jgi:ACS family hexuronate transporter-like MFS transporter
MLFLATTINYIDRQTLSLLAPTLSKELAWTERDYGNIVSWFSIVYAFGFLASGRLIDRFGVKRGLGTAVVAWSLAAMAHALARTSAGFSMARAFLGAGESAIFPGSARTVAEWFPVRERAFATGLFNAGTTTGAILTPIIVPFITVRWGWQAAFIGTGALGFLWLLAWIPLYGRPATHPRVSAAELAYIESDRIAESPRRVRWIELLGYRQTWVMIVAKVLTDPIWVFYLYWLPKFLDARFDVKLSGVALPLIAIYLTADVGSIGGGWVSSALIKRGWTVNRARKVTMLAAALLIVPTAMAPNATSLWGAVAMVAVAAAAHQAWAANVFTLGSDLFPRSVVGSVVGLGAFGGAIAAWAFQRQIGAILDANGGNYTPIFAFCGSGYIIAWVIMHILAPRMERATV